MSSKIIAVSSVCITAAIALLTTGCTSGTNHASDDSKAPPVSSTPTVTNPAGLSLPIDAYKITNDQYQKLDAATIAIEISCMKQYGFDYRPFVTPVTGPNGPDQNARRYGPADLAAAAQHGYHRADVPQNLNKATRPTMSDVMFSIFGSGSGPHTGLPTPATYGGITVPKGGCIGEAENKLDYGSKDIGLHGVVEEIDSAGFNHSLSDDRVNAAFAAWSSCMQAAGYSYATPIAAARDPRWQSSSTPSQAEVTTATADVTCKQKTNVLGIWFSVESAYEKPMIDQHATELSQVKQNIGDALKRAVAAVGAS